MTSISRSKSGWISDQVKINDMCCQIQLIINSNYCIKYDSQAYIVYVKNKYKKMCRQPKGYQYQNKCRLPSNFSIGNYVFCRACNNAHKTSLAIGSCLFMFFNNQTFFAGILTSASAFDFHFRFFPAVFGQLDFSASIFMHSLFGCRAHRL